MDLFFSMESPEEAHISPCQGQIVAYLDHFGWLLILPGWLCGQVARKCNFPELIGISGLPQRQKPLRKRLGSNFCGSLPAGSENFIDKKEEKVCVLDSTRFWE